MKQIPLTKGKVAIVDNRMYAALMAQGPWYYGHKYAVRSTRRIKGKQRTIFMHKEVLRLAGYPPSQGDHRNLKRLDNRLRNLRPATSSMNGCNKNKFKSNTSGYKGVSFHPTTGKWRAKIYKDNKQIHLGLFGSKRAAAKAYNHAAIKMHGQFARLNKVA